MGQILRTLEKIRERVESLGNEVHERRIERGSIVKYKDMANPKPVGRRKAGVPNKVNTARVERAVREGKRLPPEDLLLVADNSMAIAALSAGVRPRARAVAAARARRPGSLLSTHTHLPETSPCVRTPPSEAPQVPHCVFSKCWRRLTSFERWRGSRPFL
jgi:hypothetical protein